MFSRIRQVIAAWWWRDAKAEPIVALKEYQVDDLRIGKPVHFTTRLGKPRLLSVEWSASWADEVRAEFGLGPGPLQLWELGGQLFHVAEPALGSARWEPLVFIDVSPPYSVESTLAAFWGGKVARARVVDVSFAFGERGELECETWIEPVRPPAPASEIRPTATCRECGCTDEDCSGCVERTGEACAWVEPDLCSACSRREIEAAYGLEPAGTSEEKGGPRS